MNKIQLCQKFDKRPIRRVYFWTSINLLKKAKLVVHQRSATLTLPLRRGAWSSTVKQSISGKIFPVSLITVTLLHTTASLLLITECFFMPKIEIIVIRSSRATGKSVVLLSKVIPNFKITWKLTKTTYRNAFSVLIELVKLLICKITTVYTLKCLI